MFLTVKKSVFSLNYIRDQVTCVTVHLHIAQKHTAFTCKHYFKFLLSLYTYTVENTQKNVHFLSQFRLTSFFFHQTVMSV